MNEPLFLAFDPVAILRAAVPFLGILIALIVIHELGHFLAAKAFGIKVLEFGIGFPPKIKGWQRGETEYTLNWLPIGGFVRLLGEEDPGDPRSLAAAARWKRLTVLGAGVAMNLLLAVLLLAASFVVPRDRALNMAQVVSVSEGSPAAEALVTGEMRDGSAPTQGLLPGDLVLEVEGREVRNISELIYATRLNLGKTQEWQIQRAGSTLTAYVYARWHPPAEQGPTGITIGAPMTCSDFDEEGNPINCQLLYPLTERVWYWPWEALPKGVFALRDSVVLTVNELRVRLGGGGGGATNDQPIVSGPVGIASTTGDIIEQAGWRPLIELAALLSLSLGVFNVLPFPGLDGGRMLFIWIEIFRGGRRITPEKEALVHLIGIAFLISLIVFITIADVRRLL